MIKELKGQTMEYTEIVMDLIARTDEEEWFEFKENWFEKDRIGEYISALSNAAALAGQEKAFMVWGVNDKTHKLTDTVINYQCSYKGEPFQNYLARNLNPSIAFSFHELHMRGKRVVVLAIPAAKGVPTAFLRTRYGRIGSSIANLEKYPEREGMLWEVLLKGRPTMLNSVSPVQDLRFEELQSYYLGKGLLFNPKTFKTNLRLVTADGKYNMLACFLADNGDIPVRVAIFSGDDKASALFSVKEFGNRSLVSVIDRIIDYSSSLNIPKAIERVETGMREDVPMFDQDCFNEAVKNAFIHNLWLRRVAPMVSFFSNRVEITSFSPLAPGQTMKGFFEGRSVPVNEELSSIFLATHLSERTGKGVPLIVSRFGRSAFEITDASIKVTLPYNWIRGVGDSGASVDKLVDKTIDNISVRDASVFRYIRGNPTATQPEIAAALKIGKTSVQDSIAKLKKLGVIRRVGSNKTGRWAVEREIL